MFCGNCGKNINDEPICPYCGKSAGGSRQQINLEEYMKNGGYSVDQAGGKKSRKRAEFKMPEIDKRTMTIVLIAVAAVLVIAVIAMLLVPMIKNAGSEIGEDDGAVPYVTESPTPQPTENPKNAVKDASGYVCVKAQGDWYDAVRSSGNYGQNAHLVTFNSIEEFEFVCSLAEAQGLKSFWAGMQVSDFSDWYSGKLDLSGEAFNANNVIWLENEPSGYDYNIPEEERVFEDCMVVMYVDGKWVANDAPGSTAYTSSSAGYIMEIEQY